MELQRHLRQFTVAYMALSKGGCKIFGKRHSNKMIEFLSIVYFHGTTSHQSVFLALLNSVGGVRSVGP